MKRVLIVGGAPEYVGAVYLTAITALRTGAESVIVATPEKVAWALNALSPDLMTRKLKGPYLTKAHERDIKKLLSTTDVLVIGNGAGTRPGTEALMRSLARWKGLKVIDADALKALKEPVENAILTPNEGEWNLLVGKGIAGKLIEENVVVVKSAETRVLSGKRVFKQKQVNPGLAKAGMGDVLAGLCAGYLAQGMSRLDATRQALKTGNDVADVLTKRKKGYYFLASDLAHEITRSLPTRARR